MFWQHFNSVLCFQITFFRCFETVQCLEFAAINVFGIKLYYVISIKCNFWQFSQFGLNLKQVFIEQFISRNTLYYVCRNLYLFIYRKGLTRPEKSSKNIIIKIQSPAFHFAIQHCWCCLPCLFSWINFQKYFYQILFFYPNYSAWFHCAFRCDLSTEKCRLFRSKTRYLFKRTQFLPINNVQSLQSTAMLITIQC